MVIPEYNKPEAPGIWMNFDNTVGIYHIIQPEDTFDQAAQAVFSLVKQAQTEFPDWPRTLYIDILGHLDEHGRFDEAFVEFQQEFLFSTWAHFVAALETPLTGPLVNPNPQRNDVPDSLAIQSGYN